MGTVVNGKFQIHGVIANGGMGRIYRGEQIPLGRPVAIKVLHSKYTSSQEDPAFQKRFFLEASILARLQHPNIVTVFDYGRIEGLEDESYFMAMEFLSGETLHRRLRALGALPPIEAIGLVRQIARGLREAHRQGVVHRDLKPSNVMLVPENDGAELVKILDFGLVKVLADDSEELTKEGTFLGSPRYMSPEQIAHGKVDHRTDVYSLGVILYHCLCGRTPFENENSVHTLMAHLQLPVPPMRDRNPAIDVPEVLETFVRRCLEKDPNGRPSTMEEFLRGLRDCEVALGLAPAMSPPTAPSGQFNSGQPQSFPAPVEHTGSQSWNRSTTGTAAPVTPTVGYSTAAPAAVPPSTATPAAPSPRSTSASARRWRRKARRKSSSSTVGPRPTRPLSIPSRAISTPIRPRLKKWRVSKPGCARSCPRRRCRSLDPCCDPSCSWCGPGPLSWCCWLRPSPSNPNRSPSPACRPIRRSPCARTCS